MRAVSPPLSHFWLPPAFLKLGPLLRERWGNGAAASRVKPLPSRLPLIAAGSAAILVLGIGLLLSLHSPKTAPARAAAAPTPVAVSQSAFASPTGPIVMTSPPSTPEVPPLTHNDPFSAGRQSGWRRASAPDAPSIYSLPPVPRVRTAHRRQGRDLPPLALMAVAATEGVSPAPVSFAPIASVLPIPQHTVVVSSLAPPAETPAPSWGNSHIHITIQSAPKDDSAATPSSDDGGASAAGQGDAAQQRAFALQQQGDFRHAVSAYQSAINAFKKQIAAGRDVDAAQRGLNACQTGLQICQQSLP